MATGTESTALKSRGFLLGKFLPPHRGHLFLCNTAKRLVDELTVLVCSTDAEPISGALRYQWMQRELHDVNVLHLHKNLPQEPGDHPDFWKIWRQEITTLCPEPLDLVFGSEPYVLRLAQELGARARIIDPDRIVHKISGTGLRENMVENWDDLIVSARAHFQKRLCLLGPESVGKSVLAQALAERFNTDVMPEYGRTYDVFHKQDEDGAGKGEDWSEGDLVAIAQTHIAMREAMAQAAGPFLIEDTDIIQTAIWAEFLLGEKSLALEGMLEDASFADGYLVLAPDVTWTDDGVRYAGDGKLRQWFFDEAVKRLKTLNLPHNIVTGQDWQDRTASAIAFAEARFGVLS